MALLDDVKTSLRITNDDYNAEVTGLIESCKLDLNTAGIVNVDENDALTKHAIILYAKGHFGYDNPEADRFQESYEMLKNHLSMSSDYAYYGVTINAAEQCEVTFDGKTKETDDSGEVIFYSRAKNHVPYKIADNDIAYTDITGDMTISE